MLSEGYWRVKVLGGGSGADDAGAIHARVNIEFLEGPNKGQRATYDERVDNRSAPYIVPCLKAAGWKGVTLSTLAADLKGEVETVAQVVHKQTKADNRTFAMIRSIGRTGQKPLAEPTRDQLAGADEALAAAMESGIPF